MIGLFTAADLEVVVSGNAFEIVMREDGSVLAAGEWMGAWYVNTFYARAGAGFAPTDSIGFVTKVLVDECLRVLNKAVEDGGLPSPPALASDHWYRVAGVAFLVSVLVAAVLGSLWVMWLR